MSALLNDSELPLFSQIRPQEIVPVIEKILQENRHEIAELLKKGEDFNYTWDNLCFPLELLEDRLQSIWQVVSHLSAVKDSEALRKAYEEALPNVVDYHAEIGQNEALYKAFLKISQSENFQKLDFAKQKVIKNALRDFKLSGVTLDKEKREQFKRLVVQLSDLENKFEHNILDASKQWSLEITDPKRIAGIPERSLKAMVNAAKDKGKSGWLLTLDFPSYDAVISYAEDRNLRFELYKAYNTVASAAGPHALEWDNTAVMFDILKLRHELANLLGFNNYAEYSLATKMLKKTNEVTNLLEDFVQHVKSKAKSEFLELKKFALEKYYLSEVEAWDVRFLSEKLRNQKYAFSEEELRPYFPANKVIHGLFQVANKLFGITVKEINTFETWHESVKLFEVYDENSNLRGRFYMDLYARPDKRQGAWCGDCKSRLKRKDGTLQDPLAYIVANFGGPIDNEQALLTHDEVITLFHEFGHCIHHILTTLDIPSISGNHGVEWDAIELPSQLLENWCWEKESLAFISGHYKTGDILPDALFHKLKEAKNFQIALGMIRQLEYSLFDFRLHLAESFKEKTVDYVEQTIHKIRNEISVIPTPAFNRFQNRFSHIFAGGYAAGYYSYLWSEVLSADVFEVFKQNGIFDKVTGKRLLETILEQGGSRDAIELFIQFRNRAPTINALLAQNNLI